MSEEYIVSKYQTDIVFTYEFFSDNKSIRQTSWLRLNFVRESNPKMGSVTKYSFKSWGILWIGDDKYLPDSCKHKHRDGVINHGFVVNRKKLFANPKRCRIQPCSISTR